MNKIPGTEGDRNLQKLYGTKDKAMDFYNRQVKDRMYPEMINFIKDQSMCFISTSSKTGATNTSFRAGPKGFFKVLSSTKLIYPEYKGQGIMASLGCISENPHIGLLFIDFEKTTIGLHINGSAKIIEKEDLKYELTEKELLNFSNDKPKATTRYVLIEVHETYIHCSKHIPLMTYPINEKIK